MSHSKQQKTLQGLIEKPIQLKTKDIVLLNIGAIIQARERKITWNKIAESLGLQRTTLINAFTCLLKSNVKKENNIQLSTKVEHEECLFSSPKESDAIEKTSLEENPQLQSRQISSKVGLKALGRAKLEKFNL